MIGLDTNVLLRYLMEDDEAQSSISADTIGALTQDEPGFISLVVLVEMIWVLGRSYRIPQREILLLVEDLLSTDELRLQQPDAVRQAVRTARATSADFSDALISTIGAAAGCDTTVTLDRSAAELDGMTLLVS